MGKRARMGELFMRVIHYGCCAGPAAAAGSACRRRQSALWARQCTLRHASPQRRRPFVAPQPGLAQTRGAGERRAGAPAGGPAAARCTLPGGQAVRTPSGCRGGSQAAKGRADGRCPSPAISCRPMPLRHALTRPRRKAPACPACQPFTHAWLQSWLQSYSACGTARLESARNGVSVRASEREPEEGG